MSKNIRGVPHRTEHTTEETNIFIQSSWDAYPEMCRISKLMERCEDDIVDTKAKKISSAHVSTGRWKERTGSKKERTGSKEDERTGSKEDERTGKGKVERTESKKEEGTGKREGHKTGNKKLERTGRRRWTLLRRFDKRLIVGFTIAQVVFSVAVVGTNMYALLCFYDDFITHGTIQYHPVWCGSLVVVDCTMRITLLVCGKNLHGALRYVGIVLGLVGAGCSFWMYVLLVDSVIHYKVNYFYFKNKMPEFIVECIVFACVSFVILCYVIMGVILLRSIVLKMKSRNKKSKKGKKTKKKSRARKILDTISVYY